MAVYSINTYNMLVHNLNIELLNLFTIYFSFVHIFTEVCLM